MKLRINHQGELVKLQPLVKRVVFPHKFGRGDRRITTRFSNRSRKNLMEKFAVIDQEKARNASFITLTYVSEMEDHKRAFTHIDTFFKRLSRKYPLAFAVWKKELQKRGAIHFHLMVWNLPFMDKEWLAYTWGEITGEWEELLCSDGTTEKVPPFTRVEYCKSRRKCWYYLSKYVGKIEKVESKGDRLTELQQQTTNAITTGKVSYRLPVGLTTAQISPLGVADDGEVVPEVNENPENEQEKSSGRWWGWFNRKAIPLAMEIQTVIEMDWRDYRRFRRDLEWVEGHTAQTHLSHTVKMFWFHREIDPATMVLNMLENIPVFRGKRPKTNGTWEAIGWT